jgi:hypothetical protein
LPWPWARIGSSIALSFWFSAPPTFEFWASFPGTFYKIFYHIFFAMKDQPSPEVKDQAFAEFRSDIDKAIDHGVEDHESSMTKMGFLFLGIFVGVIALAAVLP